MSDELPDAGQVEDYTQAQMAALLKKFDEDKAALTKNQKAAVARYNFKKNKGMDIVFADSPGAAEAKAAAATKPAAAKPAASTGTSAEDILKTLPAELQALAAKDPAELSKDEKIALAKAKSQAMRAASAAKKAAEGPPPEDVAHDKALGFEHAKHLQERFGDALAKWQMQTDKPYAVVKVDRVRDLVRYLRIEMGFDQIRDLTACDYPERTTMEVVYNFSRHRDHAHLAVKVILPRPASQDAELPEVPSIMGIYPGADWLEREVYDMYGIVFNGHTYLKRLLLPEGWTGWPLRKDYDLTKEQFVGLSETGEDIVSFRSEDGW